MTEIALPNLTIFILSFVRAAGFLTPFPFEGIAGATLCKLSLVILLSLLSTLKSVGNIAPDLSIPMLIMEFLWGVMISLPLILLVQAVSQLGSLLDVLRGQNLSEALDPLHGVMSSFTGMLSQWTFWLLLLGSGCLDSMTLRFFENAPHAGVLGYNQAKESAFVLLVIWGESFSLIVVPAMLFLMLDVCLALLGRLLSAPSLVHESFLVKNFMAWMLLSVTSGSELSIRLYALGNSLGRGDWSVLFDERVG